MCFSATASFTAAAVLGALGAVALTRRDRGPGGLMAAIPLLLAAQQALEGLIWLDSRPGPPAQGLVIGYLVFARVLWPAYAPVAAWAAEPEPRRRALIAGFGLLGAGVAAYLLVGLIAYPQTATLAQGRVCYVSGQPVPLWVALPYALAVCGPLLLASDRTTRRFGALVTLGGAVTAFADYAAFQSVWCYFAALASLALCLAPATSSAKTQTAPA